jgi:hypothetical protein
MTQLHANHFSKRLAIWANRYLIIWPPELCRGNVYCLEAQQLRCGLVYRCTPLIKTTPLSDSDKLPDEWDSVSLYQMSQMHGQPNQEVIGPMWPAL